MNQSSKTLIQLLLLVAIAGGIGAYAYFGVFQKDKQTKKQQEHDLRLFAPQKLDERTPDGGSAPAEFTRLTVTFGGSVTQLERVPGQEWRIVSPVKAKADRLVLDAIVSLLQTSRFKSTLEENPDDAALQRYGFKAPTFVVEASAEVNGQTRTVKLVGGVENVFDGSIYVRRNDEKTVYTAEGGVRFSMAKNTFDLRDKQPFAFDDSKVRKIAVKSIANDYVLERNADKQWNFTKPNTEPADNASVSAMIAAAAQERAQAFPEDTAASRTALGFDAPMVDVTLSLDGEKTVRLLVSRIAGADAGEEFYLVREDENGSTLARVGPNATQYDRNPSELRDKGLVRFKREAVTKMVFHDVSGPDVIVTKDSADASADAWRVVAPRVGKAKVFKVTSALWTLGSAKRLAVGEEHPKDWAKYGLDEKAKYIAVFGEDGKELARLTIGKPVPETPSGFFVRGSRDQVLQSDGSRFGEFPFKIEDVIDEPVTDGGGMQAPSP
jgi:hypothetical protein